MNTTRLTLTITIRGKPVQYSVKFGAGCVRLTRVMPRAKRAVTRTVTLGEYPRCDCPAMFYQRKPCKHCKCLAVHGVVQLREQVTA